MLKLISFVYWTFISLFLWIGYCLDFVYVYVCFLKIFFLSLFFLPFLSSLLPSFLLSPLPSLLPSFFPPSFSPSLSPSLPLFLFYSQDKVWLYHWCLLGWPWTLVLLEPGATGTSLMLEWAWNCGSMGVDLKPVDTGASLVLRQTGSLVCGNQTGIWVCECWPGIGAELELDAVGMGPWVYGCWNGARKHRCWDELSS